MSTLVIPDKRFIVDAHDGRHYWYDEIDEVLHPGIQQMGSSELIEYLRKWCWEDCRCQLYSIFEIRGNYTFKELTSMSILTVSKLIYKVFYNKLDEPLCSYRNYI